MLTWSLPGSSPVTSSACRDKKNLIYLWKVKSRTLFALTCCAGWSEHEHGPRHGNTLRFRTDTRNALRVKQCLRWSSKQEVKNDRLGDLLPQPARVPVLARPAVFRETPFALCVGCKTETKAVPFFSFITLAAVLCNRRAFPYAHYKIGYKRVMDYFFFMTLPVIYVIYITAIGLVFTFILRPRTRRPPASQSAQRLMARQPFIISYMAKCRAYSVYFSKDFQTSVLAICAGALQCT